MAIKSYRDLVVWQKALDLVEAVYYQWAIKQLPRNGRQTDH
jgi:hypothetical protein